jgi:hypothetical protein
VGEQAAQPFVGRLFARHGHETDDAVAVGEGVQVVGAVGGPAVAEQPRHRYLQRIGRTNADVRFALR